jgi:RNA polymerase sigma factor for flagellar operon FliA
MNAIELKQWDELRDPKSTPEEKESIRQELLAQHLPLVRMVVARLAFNFPSATAEHADLVQSGVIGLMEAVERFDPLLGVEFRTYAQNRIRGSVLDELRALDWTPRSVREKARQLNRTTETLNHALSRPPTEVETAKALGMTQESLHRLANEAQVRTLRSLEDLMENEGESASWPRREADQDALTRRQEWAAVLDAGMDQLSDRERTLLRRYYENDATFKEIADELGITESRVCQIHGALLVRLKHLLKGLMKTQPTPTMVYQQLARS